MFYPFLSGHFQRKGANSVARFIRNDVKQNISDHAMLLFLALFSTWMTQSSNQRLWSFSAAAAVECSRVCLKIGQWGFLFCSEPSYKSPRQQLRVSRSGILLGTLGLTGLQTYINCCLGRTYSSRFKRASMPHQTGAASSLRMNINDFYFLVYFYAHSTSTFIGITFIARHLHTSKLLLNKQQYMVITFSWWIIRHIGGHF